MDHPHPNPYETWAGNYDESPLQRTVIIPLQKAVADYVAEQAAGTRDLLDIGCGTGTLLVRIAERLPHARLVGLDPSPRMAGKARHAVAAIPHARIEEGSAESLPFGDAAFDTVVTCLSFHHWEDQEKALGEARRVLKEGGLFLLADTTYTHAADHKAVHAGHKFFSPDQLRGMFEGVGLSFDKLIDAEGDETLQVIVGHASPLPATS